MDAQFAAELTRTDDEIAEAMATDAALAGGLMKTLVAVRLEVLRTTRAILRQRLMAEASGAQLRLEVPATIPDPEAAARLAQEIDVQQRQLDAARTDAARFTGGLVHALKMSTVATHEQSMSMLRQRYLVARYGLHVPSPGVPVSQQNAPTKAAAAPNAPNQSASAMVVKVRLLKKEFKERSHQQYIFFDTEFATPGLKRPARAIKGQLKLNDLFGETKMTIGWTVDRPLKPGDTFVDKGQGFQYNKFMEPHQWVNSTALENMSATFDVTSILYQDGTREDLA